jgi:hypothetical protein
MRQEVQIPLPPEKKKRQRKRKPTDANAHQLLYGSSGAFGSVLYACLATPIWPVHQSPQTCLQFTLAMFLSSLTYWNIIG